MSYSEENSNQNSSEELESAQENPKEIGSAESDPSTTESCRRFTRESCRKHR